MSVLTQKKRDLAKPVLYYLKALSLHLHLRYRLANFVAGLLPDFVSGVFRGRLYRLIGFQIGEGAFIMGNIKLTSGEPAFYQKLLVCQDVVIGDHVTINLDAQVYIGPRVSIGPHVIIYTGTHPIGPGSSRRLPNLVAKPVRIEDGCWIGLAAVILPGVTIGRGSVVAAGAVIMHDVPPNSYVEGNPGKVINKLPWGNR